MHSRCWGQSLRGPSLEFMCRLKHTDDEVVNKLITQFQVGMNNAMESSKQNGETHLEGGGGCGRLGGGVGGSFPGVVTCQLRLHWHKGASPVKDLRQDPSWWKKQQVQRC